MSDNSHCAVALELYKTVIHGISEQPPTTINARLDLYRKCLKATAIIATTKVDFSQE
ncbi:MAG: hypothetical protein K0U39_02345 [Alphaproteobacteria bacterium]|nr:hypothetical protein [Alphaproteobacteria bacterium]